MALCGVPLAHEDHALSSHSRYFKVLF
jgi:hypothetical protein